MRSKKNRDYFLIILLLSLSRFPVLEPIEVYYIIVSSIILIYELSIGFKTLLNSKSFKTWIGLLILVFIIQKYNLGAVSIPASINYLLRILIAFYFAKLIGINFKYKFFNVIYILSIVSLIGYSLNLIGFNFGFEIGRHYSLILYDSFIEPGTIIRNNGPFWEPGAFAGYIMLAFLLFIEDISYLLKNKIKSLLILITLFTTFSTTGFIVLFLFILVLTFKKVNKFKFLLLLPFFIAFVFYASTLDFVGTKVTEQYTEASESDQILFSRFGSFVMDYHYFKKNPLTGNGLPYITRYSDHIDIFEPEELGGFGNGLTNFIASFGLLFVLVFFIKTANNLFKKFTYKIYFSIFLALILFGEQFINYPFIWTLLFIYGNSSNNYSAQQNRQNSNMSR